MDLEKNIPKKTSSPVPSVDLTGKWKNQLDAVMTLLMDTDGKLKGNYRTAVGRSSDIEEFELIGIVTGDLVTFIVNFGKYGSLTSWVGQVIEDNGKETIKTIWHLTRNVEDSEEEDEIGGSVLTGRENFERTT